MVKQAEIVVCIYVIDSFDINTWFMFCQNKEVMLYGLYWKEKKWKCVIFKCYSSEKLITLNTLHEVVPTWY